MNNKMDNVKSNGIDEAGFSEKKIGQTHKHENKDNKFKKFSLLVAIIGIGGLVSLFVFSEGSEIPSLYAELTGEISEETAAVVDATEETLLQITMDELSRNEENITEVIDETEILATDDISSELLIQFNNLEEKISLVKMDLESAGELNKTITQVRENDRRLNSLESNSLVGSNSELAGQVKALTQTIQRLLVESEQQDKFIAALQKKQTTLDKNSGWHTNSIEKLKKSIKSGLVQTITPVNAISASRRVDVKYNNPWKVTGAGIGLAFLLNKDLTTKLRVLKGVDVPSCGKVTEINEVQETVTTLNCVIKNRFQG